MPRRPSSHPTEAELEILAVLWDRGPSTVRQVHEVLQADRRTGLTTTLKMLQVMTDKRLTVRDDKARPHRYRPAKPEKRTQLGLLKELANRAFDGSVQKLLVRAVEDGGLTDRELAEIRKLIETLSRDK
jgi:predicted transcriptional regulator